MHACKFLIVFTCTYPQFLLIGFTYTYPQFLLVGFTCTSHNFFWSGSVSSVVCIYNLVNLLLPMYMHICIELYAEMILIFVSVLVHIVRLYDCFLLCIKEVRCIQSWRKRNSWLHWQNFINEFLRLNSSEWNSGILSCKLCLNFPLISVNFSYLNFYAKF